MYTFAPDNRILEHPVRFGTDDGEWTAVTSWLQGTFTKPMATPDGKSITPELRLTPHLLVRGYARIDRSNHDVFEKPQGFTDSQPTALFSVIYSF